MTPLLDGAARSSKFYNLGGNYELEDLEAKPKLYKVPQFGRQFENRPVHKSNFSKTADLESIQSSIKCSTATAGGKSIASQMANSNFARTKEGQAAMRKASGGKQFMIDYTR